jgi:cytochrome c oxidase subunit 2
VIGPAQLAPPLTEQADDIERVWNVFLIGALVLGALVVGLILFIVARFRRRGPTLPRQVRENIPFEIAYTLVPLLVVSALFAVTFVTVDAMDVGDDDASELTVHVTGFQWQWQFDYEPSGVRVRGTDVARPELVLPTGADVRFDLTSVDVIHSFWIPGFRFKRDLFPGQTQSFRVEIGDVAGDFPDSGVCAEFCGLDHTSMRFDVRIVTPEEFAAWEQERLEEAAP